MCDDHPLALSRRRLLTAGAAGMAGAFLGGLALPAFAESAPSKAAPNAIPPDAALKRLTDGNGRYVANAPLDRDYLAGRAARAAAQYPIAGILSCADARVAPELVFDQGPGELFIVRVAGNFVNDDGLASLEYGVKFLGVPLLMVLGHSGCGAVDAAIKVIKDDVKLPGHLPELINAIKPAINLAEKTHAADPLQAAIEQNVRYNVRKLMSAKPIIAQYVAAGRVKVVGGVYDIATGKVTLI